MRSVEGYDAPMPNAAETTDRPALGGWRLWVQFAVFSLLLLWPMFLNGAPFYFRDSVSYMKGGAVAVSFVQEKAGAMWPELGPSDEKAESEQRRTVVSGMRSATYSLFVYLASWPNSALNLVSVAQALAMAGLVLLLLRLSTVPGSSAITFGAPSLVALATSASWYTSFVMPDILAGLAILSVAILTAYGKALSITAAFSLFAIIAFSASAHASHIPLIAALLLAATGWLIVERWRSERRVSGMVAAGLIASFLVGIGVTSAANKIGVGEANVIAKRYPITLGRFIEDGPARWHLEAQCDAHRYAVCEVFDEIPRTANDFLWTEGGLRNRATPEQMDRIRAEEALIIERASADYPWTTAWVVLDNSVTQFLTFGISDLHFGGEITGDRFETFALQPNYGEAKTFKRTVEWVHYSVVALSVLILVWLIGRRALDRGAWIMVSVTVTGLAANAVICGALSAVTDRYQGRVVWVLPTVVLALLLAHRTKTIRARAA
ncbi:MAG: hypothetical protein ACFB6S_15860 [Geminicoccaceae bacterium]